MADDRQQCTKDRPRPAGALGIGRWQHKDAVYQDDEYGGLSGGGDYKVYLCPHCSTTIYVELPD